MAEIETLGILDEIQALVSDKLQVVSYKWLSRNFLVSSNSAKRLLQEFVEKHGNGLEVVYSLSGWLKDNPSAYHIRLVSKHNLAEAKQEFDGSCSVQVYSVQACIPKDPAVLWNAEFVQAEDLSRQPLTVDNCLRDNRFCGVSNSFVKRNAGGTQFSAPGPQVKSAEVSGMSKSNSAHEIALLQPQQKKVQQSSSITGLQSPDMVKDVKSESHVTVGDEKRAKPAADKEKVPRLLANKKKTQSDKKNSGTGGALANMWGHASAKLKPDDSSAQCKIAPRNSAATAEAQICAREAVEYGSSDEDRQDFNIKRTSTGEGNRKRRVVLDYSDEEDEFKDAVSLESPNPPKVTTLGSKQSLNTSGLGSNLSFNEKKEDKPMVKEVREADETIDHPLRKETSDVSKGKNSTVPSSENILNQVPATDANMNDKVVDAGPKRRKVLKTRIDARGREVTEVIWEGEEPETKNDSKTAKIAENNTVNSAVNRPPIARKSPAVGNNAPTSRGGNKKAGNNDPKQGNILSFFKKV
ncbi:DNA-directed DNA polymerase [Forsythia ovata]|uniref:DNA polymerase delta subunit 3 n=1 Tax=Forsythia ovata TaxID=205694 RepID=A0ABD1QDD1_9LAMI